MPLRRLTNIEDPVVRLKISQGTGIFLFELDDGRTDCILCDQVSTRERFLENLTIKSFKYIGFEDQYTGIESEGYPWLSSLERSVFISQEEEVLYYPQEVKIRFSKRESTLAPEGSVTADSPPEKKKVLIVDDSHVVQKLLTKIIESSEKLEVMRCASDAEQAQRWIEREEPDLITLDIHMPKISGIDFLKGYLRDKKIPVVVVSSVSRSEGDLVLEALSSGAETFIQKPSLNDLAEIKSDIIEKLETLSEKQKTFLTFKSSAIHDKFLTTEGVILIGASTGGTQALQNVLQLLPEGIPPIVIVQHIPAVFSKALADRLNQLCPFNVKEAQDGTFLEPGNAYIAPGGKQMKIKQAGKEIRIIVNDDPPVNRFQPSVDYLFDSGCKLSTTRVGVLLTGMGKDGAQGLLGLKNSGARTIAQNEASSTVFGMPKAAIELGAADSVLSLEKVSQQIISDFNRITRKKSAA